MVEYSYNGPIIDAHHHFWDLSMNVHPWLRPEVLVPHRYGDYSPIKKDYSVSDFASEATKAGVVGSVYVEAEWRSDDPVGETEYVHSIAEANEFPSAMVAQAWLDADDAAEVLAAQAAHPLVRSVRHKPGGPSGPEGVSVGERSLLSSPRWRRGYSLLSDLGLHFDLQTPWWNLPEAVSLAREFPDVTMIINHGGVLGGRDQETIAAWRARLEDIALFPNVVLKISGLCVEGLGWTVPLNREVVHDCVQIFGSNRVMFGSNFPVDRMFLSYASLVRGFKDILGSLSFDDQRDIFFGTADCVYRPILSERPTVA